MKLFHIFILFLLINCSNSKEHSYSFYYWRTEWNLDKKEQENLKKSKSQTIYARFFDIDKKEGRFTPVGKIHFSQKSNFPLTPVIFITNRTFFGIKKEEIHSLAKNTLSLIENIKNENKLSLTFEIQIDCDWTEQTREDYFLFLEELKNISKQKITCTLRLHQVKDKEKTGFPPVEKVYLMCYATYSPLENQPKNSILDVPTLKNYLMNIEEYPIKMDIALPLYSWGIVSNHVGKKKLINALTINDLSQNKNFKKISETEFEVLKDDFYFGVYLSKGFKIKIEEISQNQLDEVKHFLDKKLDHYNIVYYHLDSKFVEKYTL